MNRLEKMKIAQKVLNASFVCNAESESISEIKIWTVIKHFSPQSPEESERKSFMSKQTQQTNENREDDFWWINYYALMNFNKHEQEKHLNLIRSNQWTQTITESINQLKPISGVSHENKLQNTSVINHRLQSGWFGSK